MSHLIEAPVFSFKYGSIELVIAEHTLSRNAAPFTIIAPGDDFNTVEDTALLSAFQSHFIRLEKLVPTCIPVLRAYATLIMFYRISKNPEMNLTLEQAKAVLMGANAQDTLLFIVAKLLRHDDAELRRYLQQPHILVSSLINIKQGFILGDGNILRLFQEARVMSEDKETRRLTMKEFTALYQRIDPPAGSSVSVEAEVEGKEEKKQVDEDEDEDEEKATEAEDDDAVKTRTRSTTGQANSSPSSSSTSSAPVYRSSSSSKKKRAMANVDAGCVNCHLNNRPSELMLCDRAYCETKCHYDCCVPPLSAVPKGSWFCAACKPLVKQALDEEMLLLVVRAETKQVSTMDEDEAEEDEDDDQVEEISPERWRQAQDRWRRDREQYQKELAEKSAEVERLRIEVERFKRQRVERDDPAMEVEEERKEAYPAEEERKEASSQKRTTSTPRGKRRGRA